MSMTADLVGILRDSTSDTMPQEALDVVHIQLRGVLVSGNQQVFCERRMVKTQDRVGLRQQLLGGICSRCRDLRLRSRRGLTLLALIPLLCSLRGDTCAQRNRRKSSDYHAQLSFRFR